MSTATSIADKSGVKATDTPSRVAAKVGQTIGDLVELDKRHIYVVGERRGGNLAGGLSDGMTFKAGYGSGHSDSGAELLAEEAPDGLLYDLAFELNDALMAAGCPVRCEPATSYALAFWKEA